MVGLVGFSVATAMLAAGTLGLFLERERSIFTLREKIIFALCAAVQIVALCILWPTKDAAARTVAYSFYAAALTVVLYLSPLGIVRRTKQVMQKRKARIDSQ